MESLTYGNGLSRSVGYDLKYRVTGIQTGTFQELTYTHDPNGNIQDVIDNLDSNNNRSFSYDGLNRLEGSTGPWSSLSWGYDAVGNRLAYSDSSGTTNYSYEVGNNRLIQLSGAQNAVITYDGNGNIIDDDTLEYFYNDNNRLYQITDGAQVRGQYTYNAKGQRVTKEASGSLEIFHYDMFGALIGESITSGTFTAEYIYLNKKPIALASSTDIFFVHADHLRTPAAMTDEAGNPVWEIEPRPFGTGSTTGTESLNLRFPGQYFDEETSLHYNYFRDYVPGLGRYLQADPLGLAAGINPYIYVRNNPLILSDPFGLCDPKTDCYWITLVYCNRCVCWECTRSTPG